MAANGKADEEVERVIDKSCAVFSQYNADPKAVGVNDQAGYIISRYLALFVKYDSDHILQSLDKFQKENGSDNANVVSMIMEGFLSLAAGKIKKAEEIAQKVSAQEGEEGLFRIVEAFKGVVSLINKINSQGTIEALRGLDYEISSFDFTSYIIEVYCKGIITNVYEYKKFELKNLKRHRNKGLYPEKAAMFLSGELTGQKEVVPP
ncbi:MAG: hypothetical protein ABH858_01540, partial [Candidatus Omnitrophota bacterium]